MKYIIRQCSLDDFEDVKILLQEFHEEALKHYNVGFEADLLYKVIRGNYSECFVLVVEDRVVGLIAGDIIQYPLQTAKFFREMIWYVTKQYRKYGLELLKTLEKSCRQRGISHIIMITLSGVREEKLDRYYQMQGYNKLETHYIKGLV